MMRSMKEPIQIYLRRRLAELRGLHNQMARETGVAQATVSRIYLGHVSPTLEKAQPLLDWIEAYDRGESSLHQPRRRLERAA